MNKGNSNFAINFKRLMLSRKLNPTTFAREFHCDKMSAYAYSRGTVPGGERLVALAKFFNTTAEALLTQP